MQELNASIASVKRKTLFSIILIMFLLASTNKVDITSASPATYLYVGPSVVKGVTPTNSFNINISVTAAPQIYAWEIFFEWDPALLNVSSIKEGDFLHRWDIDPFTGEKTPKYTTTFLFSPSFSVANLQGSIKVVCSLLGDVPWSSGDGWLLTFGFTVKAYGSSVLKLFKTSLYDHFEAGSPAPTYYSNNDGFFYNEAFHDIAVTNVQTYPTTVVANEAVTINVTVTNQGNFTETFDVAAYADIYAYDALDPDVLLVGDEITVGTQTVTDLTVGAATTLTFTLNTTGVAEGNYTISAKSLLLDDDTRDNTFINGKVTVKTPALHDIAVTNVVLSSTEVTVGENVTITVTIKNEGGFNETFDVIVFYDNTAIANKTNTTLMNGTSTTLTFTWDTTGVSEGTYTISARVPPVAGERDSDKADNTFAYGNVKVRGPPTSNIFIYAAAGAAIVIAAAIVVYIVKFRKP